MTPVLTREQIRRVDQLAIERYGIAGLVLMENAGRNAAEIIRNTFPDTRQVAICCGPGNNGGDGCVIARHLHNAGWSVRLMVAGERSRMSADCATNYRIIEAMGLDVAVMADAEAQLGFAGSVQGDDVVVDALLGTGFSGQVRSPTAELIEVLNAGDRRGMVAVDIPSGLDCDTGLPSNATIRADITVTFVAKKTGLIAQAATEYVGRICVADIGAPRELVYEIAGGDV